MATTVNWVQVTTADLLAILTDDEFTALNADNKADTQAKDRIAVVIPAVVSQVRADIACDSRNVLDPSEQKVPPSLKLSTMWLIVEQLAMNLSLVIKLTDERKALIRDSKERLTKVREGVLRVETPRTSGDDHFQSARAELVDHNDMQMLRDSLDTFP